MNTRKYGWLIVFVPAVLILMSCASLPKESVLLNQSVGKGIYQQYTAQVTLINMYFLGSQQRLDKALDASIRTYMKTLTVADSITLSRQQLQDVSKDLMGLVSRHNKNKHELEEARILLQDRLHENYTLLQQANTTLTGMLQSAVDLTEAKEEAFQSLSAISGFSIDMSEISAAMDNYILHAEEKASEAVDLVDLVRTILNSNRVEESSHD